MRRIVLHSLPLRIWHWTNAGAVILLIATGLYLRFHGIASLSPHDPVLLWHKGIGVATVVATLFWILHTLLNPNQRRQYRMTGRDLRGIPVQARFYLLSMFSGGENPFTPSAKGKYNPLQKTAYAAVMFVFMPVQAATGLLFLDIPVLRDYLLAGNLMGLLGATHVIFAYGLVLYLIVHLYMATLGDRFFSHTMAMIVGYEEQDNGMKRGSGGPTAAETSLDGKST
ncbi:MAG: cytochrome b/b6 domain-containing protein [Deltaproteobacteria bacterium]|nr:cytochrome b/b6 domain-containing protein [Deltaproteobacteria bacterium]